MDLLYYRKENGFQMHLIALMENLYEEQEATVRKEVGEWKSFQIGKGQVCTL